MFPYAEVVVVKERRQHVFEGDIKAADPLAKITDFAKMLVKWVGTLPIHSRYHWYTMYQTNEAELDFLQPLIVLSYWWLKLR